ncbi:MAG TPA: DUF805 domain-containing protein [Acetobacteraceae bacterium]|jgi:uncharacterized membrane protein YhaH (DUF805 family)|nr:DUF805 domain-containing protein [Acetobacteraceae bacterium]
MSFGEAISVCFSKYATFTGRAARPEYWYWVLFTVVASLVFVVIEVSGPVDAGRALDAIFNLATIIPSIAVAARRLHDTDRSGWWQLLLFIPVIGWILLLIWLCQPGTPGANRFGSPA